MLIRNMVNMYKLNIEKIKKFILATDLEKGERYPYFYVVRVKEEVVSNENKIHTFNVESQRTYAFYVCKIEVTSNGEIRSISCKCDDFAKHQSCKHLAACFYRFSEYIFDIKNEEEFFSNILLEKYASNEHKIKKELKVDLDIELRHKGSRYTIELRPTIGDKKMYNLGTKFKKFYQCYKKETGSVVFGKELTYLPEEYYFNDKNKRLIECLSSYYNYNYYSEKESQLLKLFTALEGIPFTINSHMIHSYKEEFPLETKIKKEGERYLLSFHLKEDICNLDSEYRFIYSRGNIYKLNNKESHLLEDIVDNDIDTLSIKKEDLTRFTGGLLNIIKTNAILDESVDGDIVISSKPDTEIYFDIGSNEILANIVFLYDSKKIDFFDIVPGLARDHEYENQVLSFLLDHQFVLEDKKLKISSLSEQVEFLEHGIDVIAEKYKVFTSERLKEVSIKHHTGITSTFSIGSDHILSYQFDLDGIASEELVNIFKDMRMKKKYYRLKNGDILNLEDENLRELEDLSSEMEISDEEIINGKGEIEKYRAIYLDSLKSGRYQHVKTDNLFNEFIQHFYEYKDSALQLSKKDLSLLREYQLTGIKWLYNIHKTGFGGILADEMGLGKTLQAIFYSKQLLLDNEDSKILIIVPTALVYNWSHEFEKFAPDIKVVILSGMREKRRELLEMSTHQNVYITSYGMLREDIEYYKKMTYDTIIIDEAQNIKNYTAGITKTVKSLKATTKIALTGTPVENSPMELWSIFDFIMPGYLSSIMRFKRKYNIKDFDEETNQLLEGLSRQITPFIMRRKKQDVIKELPPKMENTIYVEMTDMQKKIYAAELERVKKEMENILKFDGIKKANFMILSLLTTLRQICIDPGIIYEDYKGGSNKIESLLMTLKENVLNGNKVLMFTSFKKALHRISEELEREEIPYYIIDGSVSALERDKRVREFNERDSGAVFLITLKAGGVGLNLASATTVIHLDLWWNPQAENQATDRAHRIGQKEIVEVIHLVCKGTIEEKILELQMKKRELANRLLDESAKDQDIISSLSEKDIKELLSYENNF